MASKLEQLQNQSSPEALRILALGGNPTQSQAVRSGTFVNALQGINEASGFDAGVPLQDMLRERAVRQRQFDEQSFSRAQDAIEAQHEVSGTGSSGRLERDVIDLLEKRKDFFDPLKNFTPGGGRSAQPRGPSTGRPSGPRTSPGPRSGVGPKPAGFGFDGDLGLQAASVESPDVDADALRNTLSQEQRKFSQLMQTGDLSVGAGPVGQRELQQRGLSEGRTDFRTLGGTRSPQRRPGESLDEFVNRSRNFNRDPANMTRGELAGTTLQALAQIKQGNKSLQNVFNDVQSEFTTATAQDRTSLEFMQGLLQNVSQEQTIGDNGFPRALTPEEQQDRITQIRNTMLTAAKRVDQQRTAALTKARTAQQNIMRNLTTAQQRVKTFAKTLDQQSALKTRANRAAAQSRYDELDKNLYHRLSRRFGQDPNAINSKTGLPNWQVLRTQMTQEEAQKQMQRFRQVGAGGLSDPKQEFQNTLRERRVAKKRQELEEIEMTFLKGKLSRGEITPQEFVKARTGSRR